MASLGAVRVAISVAVVSASVAILFSASPVAAECSFVPPWPKVSLAIPSARDVVIGDVVSEFPDLHLAPGDAPRDYALKVTEVLRGDAEVGDYMDIQWMLANWPQQPSLDGTELYASCSSLNARAGETIALAIDARIGGPMHAGQLAWVQPPTLYNAIGVIETTEGLRRRERVTLDQVRQLAALPQTDAESIVEPDPVSPPLPALAIGFLTLVFLIDQRVLPAHRRRNIRG